MHREIREEPYVITPEEFDPLDDSPEAYEKITLTYYADDILADDGDIVVDDVEFVIGSEALESFGEYEEDAVYVRNDKLKTEYEIVRDERNYIDVAADIPPNLLR